MRIALTGSSGLVGQALMPVLRQAGHDVVRLVRHAPRAADELQWLTPGEPRFASQPALDAVIHLAGAPVAEKRWSDAVKAEIVRSRVAATEWLVEALTQLAVPPSVLISASAVGFYGDSGDGLVDEHSPRGGGFLAEVCAAWEQATAGAASAGIRVVNLRIGVVLTPAGGMLGKLLPVFRMGGGGPVGSGDQWLPWIALPDLLRMVLWALDEEGIRGPVNAVSPYPVRQNIFARQLGQVLHRPTWIPTPAFVLQLAFGQMADEVLLAGQNVQPLVLARSGFVWEHPELGEALGHLLAYPSSANSTSVSTPPSP